MSAASFVAWFQQEEQAAPATTAKSKALLQTRLTTTPKAVAIERCVSITYKWRI